MKSKWKASERFDQRAEEERKWEKWRDERTTVSEITLICGRKKLGSFNTTETREKVSVKRTKIIRITSVLLFGVWTLKFFKAELRCCCKHFDWHFPSKDLFILTSKLKKREAKGECSRTRTLLLQSHSVVILVESNLLQTVPDNTRSLCLKIDSQIKILLLLKLEIFEVMFIVNRNTRK